MGIYLTYQTKLLLKDMPTEVYYTEANKFPVKEVWMVSDVYGKMKRMKIDWLKEKMIKVTKNGFIYIRGMKT